eukprot:5197008-Lingulodinium_polyedra.AAC.1
MGLERGNPHARHDQAAANGPAPAGVPMLEPMEPRNASNCARKAWRGSGAPAVTTATARRATRRWRLVTTTFHPEPASATVASQ